MKRPLLVGMISLTLASGCAGVPPAQVGQTVGTIAGSAILPGIGTTLGALVGLLTGMVVQGEMDKVTEKHERQELSDRLAAGPPSTSAQDAPPQGESARVWVDETVHDGRMVAGHFDVRPIP